MPYVKVEMFEGRTEDQKRNVIRGITDALVQHADCPPETVWVVIDEKDTHNWGIGGLLVSERGTKTAD